MDCRGIYSFSECLLSTLYVLGHHLGNGRGKMSHMYCLLSRSSFSCGESSHGFRSYWLFGLGPCCFLSLGLSSHIYRTPAGDGWGLPGTARSQVYMGSQNRAARLLQQQNQYQWLEGSLLGTRVSRILCCL